MDNKVIKTTYNKILSEEDFCLTDSDFYPPSDDRILKSQVRDISGGDTFAKYTKYIFDLYESEDYYEN